MSETGIEEETINEDDLNLLLDEYNRMDLDGLVFIYLEEMINGRD